MRSFRQFITEGAITPPLQGRCEKIFVAGPHGPNGLVQYEQEYNGQTGSTRHITMNQDAWVPISTLLTLKGVMGEVREFDADGRFGNYSKEQWAAFLADISTNGITEPVFITVDYGKRPEVSEGNHRIQALRQLGYKYAPCQIRYFGNAQLESGLDYNGKFGRGSV